MLQACLDCSICLKMCRGACTLSLLTLEQPFTTSGVTSVAHRSEYAHDTDLMPL